MENPRLGFRQIKTKNTFLRLGEPSVKPVRGSSDDADACRYQVGLYGYNQKPKRSVNRDLRAGTYSEAQEAIHCEKTCVIESTSLSDDPSMINRGHMLTRAAKSPQQHSPIKRFDG